VAAVRQLFPAKIIVLTGVDNDLFYSALWDQPFRAFGIGGVYLDPAEQGGMAALARSVDPASADFSPFFIDASVLQQLLIAGQAEVLSVAAPVAIDVTPRFEAAAKSSPQSLPRRLNPGSCLSSAARGTTWRATTVGWERARALSWPARRLPGSSSISAAIAPRHKYRRGS
jgi:hypothetical protein